MENTFARVLMCQDKKELKKLCKTLTVEISDFVDVIAGCKAGAFHLNHAMHFFDYVPEHLETRESDFEILDASLEVQASSDGQKAFRRLFKTHGQRQYRVAHMFFSREVQHPFSEWHMVFFEMDELSRRNNHWCGGSHIHITNYLWPNLYCQDLLEAFLSRKEFPSSKLHLAFNDQERRGYA
ncbi:MAG: hypothetical protein HGA77_02045 [Chlorobiaceae bacterium]|nr:hypothetical protein [Chlorobiaceae bacterium]